MQEFLPNGIEDSRLPPQVVFDFEDSITKTLSSIEPEPTSVDSANIMYLHLF